MLTDSKVLLVIRVSYNWNQVLARNLYFKAFCFYWKIFCRTRWHDVPQHGVRRVQEGSPCHRWGSRGPSPGNFFCKYKLWEGHFMVILRAPGEKKAKKRLFTEIGKKKVFASKKRFKRFPWEACIYLQFYILCDSSTLTWHTCNWNPFSWKTRTCLFSHSRYHGCWWLGNAMSQGINNQDIELIKPR